MDGVRIEIDISQIRPFGQKIEKFERSARNINDLLDQIGRAMVANTKARFDTGEAPGGQKWPKSARVMTGQGGKTLWDTGRLRASLNHHVSANAVAWGTNLVYAAIHQFGGTIKPLVAKVLKFKIPGIGFRSAKEVIMPARPYVGIDGDDRADIDDLFQNHFKEALN